MRYKHHPITNILVHNEIITINGYTLPSVVKLSMINFCALVLKMLENSLHLFSCECIFHVDNIIISD